MTLEELAKNYQPGERAREVVSQSNVVLLVGISGAGKDTIQTEILKNADYHKVVTHTTRQPRYNNGVLEQNGSDYHFVTEEEMYELLQQKKMIEVNQFGRNYYGASLGEFEYANKTGKITIADIDIHGIDAMRRMGDDSVRALFILPPSYDEWVRRLRKRYPDDVSFSRVFEDRKVIAIDELEHALSVPYYHFIINDKLDRAVRIVDEIAHRTDVFCRKDDEARLLARDILEEIRTQPAVD